jgi:hypothetical protein
VNFLRIPRAPLRVLRFEPNQPVAPACYFATNVSGIECSATRLAS